ncbi:MAG: Uncharacterised protein [Acidimicrobiales bacterium AG-410-I20]|nr:MAG: Uncharacterised protein [Acidimicrobiales bacterium AG-410-I20]
MDISLRDKNFLLLTGLRVIWLALPLGVGPLMADGLHPLENTPRSVLSVILWVLWGMGIFSTFVPRPLSLTVIRFGAVTSFILTLWAATTSSTASVIICAFIFVTVALAIGSSATIGDLFIDRISYGNERRFLLRAPAAVTSFLRPATYITSVVGLVAGPYLLADGRTIAGVIACVIGFPLTFVGLRSLHQINRRWVVLVPAGLVLHDHLSLNEPTLFQKSEVESVGPAPVGTDAVDFTQGAYGLALEVRCSSPHDVWLSAVKKETEKQAIETFLFAPVQPDHLLTEATRRSLTSHSPT